MLIGLCVNFFASSTNELNSLENAWKAYARTQRQFQQELADFFGSRRPDLKDLIQTNRDLQLALIDRRSLEFRYLLSTHPERIVKDQGISRFANFGWTEEDSIALQRANQEYEAVVKRVEELRKRSQSDSQWLALRAAQKALANDAELKKIYQRFEGHEQAVQKLLEGKP